MNIGGGVKILGATVGKTVTRRNREVTTDEVTDLVNFKAGNPSGLESDPIAKYK